MKKIFLTLSIAATLLASCSKDESGSGNTPSDNELKGDIVADVTLDPETTYTLTGRLLVKEGATLTIPAGTTIKAVAGGTDVYVLVERGAKIMADGSADAPITFTSDAASPQAGDWGGLIINGYAPISGATEGTEAATEVNNAIKYGGTKVDDNSGVLDHIIIEYTGARIDAEAEHNGLTLNAVGNGTAISNLMIAYGDDDAIEFFGGSVDVENILVVNAKDDMFDFTQGYTGTVTNVYGIREAGFVERTSDPRGIEADGNLDGKGPDHVAQSDFVVDGLTIDNRAVAAGDNGKIDDAIKIRRGAKAMIKNAMVITNVTDQADANYGDVIDLVDSRGAANAATTVSCQISDNVVWKVGMSTGSGDSQVDFAGTEPTEATANTGADKSAFSWTAYQF